MPVDGDSAGISDKGQDEQPWQCQPFGVTKLGEPDHHPIVPSFRLDFIGAKQSVPPGEIEAVVAIRLPYDHGMMHPVHVGCHDKKPEDPIHLFGNVNVAVVEHRCGVKGHLTDEDSQGRGPERSNGRELNAHGDDDFDGVEAHSRGHIKIEIRVVNHVQSPKNRPHIFCVQRCRNRSVGPLERDVHQCSVLSLKSVLSETLVVISKRPR